MRKSGQVAQPLEFHPHRSRRAAFPVPLLQSVHKLPLASYISARPGDKAARLCLRTLALPHRLPSGSPLPSTLFPRLHRYYGPLRLPDWRTRKGPLYQATIHQPGPPVLRQCLSRHAVSTFPGRERVTICRF